MSRSGWLVSAPFDLSFIIGSAILLFVPHAVHLLWPSNIVVDLVIAAAIGGPHLFATYTLTFMEPNFRRRYPRYTAGALLLPLLVLVTAVVNLDLLVTAFFLLAALHVIHQAGYVADSYRDRRPEPAAAQGLSRLVDYGLLLSSLFVLASFKFTGAPLRIFGMELSEHQFATGGRRLLFPAFLQVEVLAWTLMAVFLLCAAAFAVKSLHEAAQGRLNLPKTLHLVVAAGLFFVTPALQNLDVAFQGLNTWHSVQYLAHGDRPQPLPPGTGPDRLARGGALRYPRRAPLLRRPGPYRRLRAGLPGAARHRGAAGRMAGRRTAAALLRLLRLGPVGAADPLLLRPLPVPAHRRRDHPAQGAARHRLRSQGPSHGAGGGSARRWGCGAPGRRAALLTRVSQSRVRRCRARCGMLTRHLGWRHRLPVVG